MTTAFSLDRFLEATHALQTLMNQEAHLLETQNYHALSLLWLEKEALLKTYAHQSFLFQKEPQETLKDHERETFRRANQTLLSQAQRQETKLKQLHDLAHLILDVMTEAACVKLPHPHYGPEGILKTPPRLQEALPLKTNQYL